MQGTAEWLGPGRHGQQGGQSYQLWTVGSAPETGTRSIFPSQVRGTAQTVGIQGSSWGLLTSRKPQEALERIQRSFLWSVLCPSLCAERLLWPGRASPSASQLLAFSPGQEQAAGLWET